MMEFPRDHYNHSELKAEWWYFAATGELKGIGPANCHISFFRKFSRKLKKDIFFGHFGLDVNGKFFFKEKRSGHAKAANGILQVFIDDWDFHRVGDRYVTMLDKGTSFVHIAEKKSVIHEPGYYSITRTRVQGSIEGEFFKGQGWFDHEFHDTSSMDLLLMKYLWFGIQLRQEIEIMLYIKPSYPASSSGSIIFPYGGAQRIEAGDCCIRSEDDNGWILELPKYGMRLELHKRSENKITGALGPDYTEGTVDVINQGKIGQGFFEIS